MVLFAVAGCSTKKNTAATRFYHSFTARYNTYFNGHEAYKAGVLSQEESHVDNFTETLPLFIVSNKKTAQTGSGNFETTITKCEKAIKNHSIKRKPKMSNTRRRTAKQKKILAKREYNPFLKNAWMLMGKAQFRRGEFVEAASTFSYIARLYAAEPDVLAESRAWLATCYSELDWFYDAEDIFVNKIKRDSLPHSALKDLDYSYADFYVRQGKFKEALPYLERVVKHTKGARGKARIHYLIGQIQNMLGEKEAAYKSLSRVIRLSPPYEVTVNARVMQTEVVPQSKAKKMLRRLRSMARQSKNAKYSDRIYYAMGNIYLAQKDTAKAILAYENGVKKCLRNGVEKGALLLRLAELYYVKNDFTSCSRCYSRALNLIDKERDDYEKIEKIAGVVKKLEPHTAAVFLQDSLQAVAAMPESKQNEIIDKIIEIQKEVIKKEKRKEEIRARQSGKGGRSSFNRTDANKKDKPTDKTKDEKGAWYFYNQQTVNQGKETFRRQWGERELEDNWRRSDKEISDSETDTENTGQDTDKKVQKDSTKLAKDSVSVNDTVSKVKKDKEDKKEKIDERLTREFYTGKLPVTEEQKAASDKIIMENLHAAGVIEKDFLENLPLAEKTLIRLYEKYPSYEKMNEVLYQLFLLYSRMDKPDQAEFYKSAMVASYADDGFTKMITDPNFAYDARFGKHIEDSIYQVTYNAYCNGDAETIIANSAMTSKRYPDGENRAKFMFLNALAHLRKGDQKVFTDELNALIEKYPKEEITAMAKAIVNGVKEGRVPGTGLYDLGSLWNRRSAGAAAALDSLALEKALSAERNTEFTVVVAYPVDSVDENHLLYDLAYYNFTNFAVRNFEIEQAGNHGLGELRIKGFQNFDEAHVYAQKLYNQEKMRPYLEYARLIVISNVNLEKLGIDYSISDYEKFYSVQFAPLKVKPNLQLDQQTDIYISEDELPGDGKEEEPEEVDEDGYETEDEDTEDEGEWFDM